MRKKILLLPIALISSILIIGLFAQEFTYVGADKCKICHKTKKQGRQFPIWEESRHSKSFEDLFSETALEVAKKRNLDKPPSEHPDCLKCHGPLYEKAPEIKAEGVTCEVCHGPGSAYKKLSIMKNREKSKTSGLVVYESPEAIKKLCSTCHSSEEFDFEASWEKIKHPKSEIQ